MQLHPLRAEGNLWGMLAAEDRPQGVIAFLGSLLERVSGEDCELLIPWKGE